MYFALLGGALLVPGVALPLLVSALALLSAGALVQGVRGYRRKQVTSSGPRGSDRTGAFTPIVGGWAFASFFIAFVTFGYFFVQYRLVPDLLVPAILGFLELIGGLSMAAVLVKVKVELDLWGGVTMVIAAASTAAVLGIELLIGGIFPGAGLTPTSTTTAVVLSPMAEVLFYYSQGVAEACAFVLFIFSALVKSTHSFAVALALSSIGFMVYHLGVVNIVYQGAYWASLPFLATIFAGNLLWSTVFYFYPRIGFVSWSHGGLNTIVTTLGLAGLVAITFSGVRLP